MEITVNAGAGIAYWAGQDVRLGRVARTQGKRYQVERAGGRVERVNRRFVFAACDSLTDVAHVETSVAERQDGIDVDLLWEILQDPAAESPTLGQMAELYFGDNDLVSVAALARALTEDPVHFKRQGLGFEVRTAEQAAEVEAVRRRRAARAEARARALEWVRTVLSRPELQGMPEALAPFIADVEAFVLRGDNTAAVQILTEASRKRSALQSGVLLLQKLGRLPDGTDPYLLENGIHTGFSQAVVTAAAGLEPYTGDDSRVDLTAMTPFSIDDDETTEIDDALSVEIDGDTCLVGIHIAFPASFVQIGEVLDQAARDRPLSLYLPTSTVHMLPERVSCDLASLVAGDARPAMSFLVRFGPDACIADWEIRRSVVRVEHRLNYERADALLSGEDDAAPAAALRTLHPLAEALAAERRAGGAFQLNRPELKVRVRSDTVTVRPIDWDAPARQLVSEMMILANRLAGEFALRHDVPVIYRQQDAPSEPIEMLPAYDPMHFDAQIRKLTRTRLSTYPGPHAGLGLELYTQVSSPLRRYADLVVQRQLSAQLKGESLPYSREALMGLLSEVDATSRQNRTLEREAIRYWLLEYIKEKETGQVLSATVVRSPGRHMLAELEGYCVRGILHAPPSVVPGMSVRVRVASVTPRSNTLVLHAVD